jgi:hypothetical protein
MTLTTKRSLLTKAAALLIATAGIIHLFVAFEHRAHSSVHGVTMALFGLVQIVWSLWFWRSPTSRVTWLGFVLSTALITLWALTLIGPAAFGHGEVNALGVIIKVCEGLGATALISLMLSIGHTPVRWRTVAAGLAAAVIIGSTSYGVALAVEPFLQPEAHGDHEHGEHHDPEPSEHHDHEPSEHHDPEPSEHHDPEPSEHHDHEPGEHHHDAP